MSNDSLRDQSGRALSEKNLKVTDRRMFTPEGVLREEFQQLEKAAESGTEAAPPTDRVPAGRSPAATGPASPMPDAVPEPAELGAPGFFDLIRLLAEHASIYLAEARDASPREASHHLELARLHIDLLAVLQHKTKGNLTPPEMAMLQDAMHQLRAGYVGLQG